MQLPLAVNNWVSTNFQDSRQHVSLHVESFSVKLEQYVWIFRPFYAVCQLTSGCALPGALHLWSHCSRGISLILGQGFLARKQPWTACSCVASEGQSTFSSIMDHTFSTGLRSEQFLATKKPCPSMGEIPLNNDYCLFKSKMQPEVIWPTA